MKRRDTDQGWPDGNHAVSRRTFMTTAIGATLAAATVSGWRTRSAAAPTPQSQAETAVRRFYDSLSVEQRQTIVLLPDDTAQLMIAPNWKVTDARIGDLRPAQQELIHEIVRGLTSEDGYERFVRQMADDGGGIANYWVGIFGNPYTRPFQFEMTGRHLILRADGNTMKGVAFGGPLVYGHIEPGNSPANLFWYQSQQANEVFKMLDGRQRTKALQEQVPQELAVQIRKPEAVLPGIAVGELSPDQQAVVSHTLRAILQPYRQEDVDEVMEMVQAGGGLDRLHMAFYSYRDLGADEVWDTWRLEGPTLVCYFRGAPHVHAYLNVAQGPRG